VSRGAAQVLLTRGADSVVSGRQDLDGVEQLEHQIHLSASFHKKVVTASSSP
jgi:hypothetical protein